MSILSPYCIFCITRAEVDLVFEQTITPHVRELRWSAIKGIPGYLLRYTFDNMHPKLIDAVCEKKIGFIMKAETMSEVREIMQPPRPVQTYGKIQCRSPYHIPEEELMLWAHVSPNNNLTQAACKRYIALFEQVFGCSVEEYLRSSENDG